MHRWLLGVLALAFMISPSAAYQLATVKAAQEALTRLGYDVGEIDGQWGGKSRAAMNEVRAKEGLPPAQDFTGSSLWLIHKLSPGETTLPHPGRLVTDLLARRDDLRKTSIRATALCDVMGGLRADEAPVPKRVTPINTPNGFITAKDDWYSEIQEGLVEAEAMCVVNKKGYCDVPIRLAAKWAEADALRPGVRPGQKGAQDVFWIGNTVLRAVINSYNTASTLQEVDPVTHALILDWIKRRVDDYHSSDFGGSTLVGDPENPLTNNHALARMMPAMAFGAMVGDRSMMQPAFDTWKQVLASMREDGSLPTETRRGARWFHYSTLHIGQLLAVSRAALAQEIDLAPPSPDRGIPLAMTFLVNALQDFDLAKPYSKANHGSPSSDYTIPFVRKFHLGILPAYRAEFGDDTNIQTLRTMSVDERLCSSKAMKENKGEVCDQVAPPYTFAAMLSKMEQMPHPGMGFPAGCLLQNSLLPLAEDP